MLKKYIIAILIVLTPNFNAFSGEFNKKSKTKILLIGIDGLEWSIIERLNEENKMPVFAELIRKGAYSGLHTYLEFSSPSLWTTIATGKKPEAHGINGFLANEKGTQEPVSSMSYHRKVKALWNILTDHGRRVGVINYFCTKPPEVVNGFMIPDNDFSLFKNRDVYPNSLASEITPVLEENLDTATGFFEYAYPKDATQSLNKISGSIKETAQVYLLTSYLYKKFNKHFDLLMLYLSAPDSTSHLFWKFMDPKPFEDKAWGINSNNIEKYGNVINETYQMVDKFIGKIVEDIVDKNTIVIICSDHGFRSATPIARFSLSNLNKILNKIGVLHFKDEFRFPSRSSKKETLNVDFFKSQAYHSPVDNKGRNSLFISINLKGEGLKGIVQPGKEYLKLKRGIIKALSNLTIVETGEKLFGSVTESNFPQTDIKVITRNHVNLLDLHTRIKNHEYSLKEFYTFSDVSGDHSDPAVIIISGKNIKAGEIGGDVHILDIAPTILYLLGLPVPKDMEGKVLTEAMEKGFLKAHPIRYISSYEPIEIKKEEKDRLIEPTDAEELERLKTLGYVQ